MNPLIGLSIGDLAKAGIAIVKQTVLQPAIGAEHLAKLFAENIRIISGESKLSPHSKDRRFFDPAFTNHSVYRRLAQNWVALQQEVDHWVEDAGFGDADQERARFVLQLFVDAFAPTNFLDAPYLAHNKKKPRPKRARLFRLMPGSDLLSHGNSHTTIGDASFHC